MFKGTMQVTTDLNVVQNMMGTHRIVVIGEHNPQLIQATNGIVASLLLPPYPAMMLYADGNMNSFNTTYMSYLSGPECTSFFSVLVKSLINGTNILLYLTPDEYNMYYNSLSMYILNAYGISIGNGQIQFGFNVNYLPQIYSLLYVNELITIQELFMVYPSGMQFNDAVVMKLINEMRPVLQDTSFESYRNYFYNYKESVKQTNSYIPNLFSRKL